MFAKRRILFAVALGLWFAGSPAAQADEKPAKPKPVAEPVKPGMILIDASKLPPDVLKQLLRLAEEQQPTGKPEKPTSKPEPGKPGIKPEPAKPEQTKPVKPGEKPGDQAGKPVVIQIHVDQLPPDVLKQLLQLAGKQKPAPEGGKPGKPGAK